MTPAPNTGWQVHRQSLSDDGVCEYCTEHVPAKGYWRCPKCDAEWPEEDEPVTLPPPPETEK